jgi:DNA-binding transcriptional MerR regulator
MAEDAQPTEGQGPEVTGSPYDSYLQAVPEEAKEAAEQWFRDTSKGLDAKLQEAAELRNTLGPYKDVDLSSYDPESLSQLIAWHQQVTGDQDAYKAFIEQEAREMGLTEKEAEEIIAAEQDGATPEAVQQLVQQIAEERLAPIEEQFTQLQQEKAVDHEVQAIDQAFAELQTEHKLELSKDQKAMILDLGMPLAYDEKGNELPMGDASWVKAGFDRWEEITTAGARTFVETKAQTPGSALTTGATPALKPITDWKDANDALRERLRQQP